MEDFLRTRLSQNCCVNVIFNRLPKKEDIKRLIQHLELMIDCVPDAMELPKDWDAKVDHAPNTMTGKEGE